MVEEGKEKEKKNRKEENQRSQIVLISSYVFA